MQFVSFGDIAEKDVLTSHQFKWIRLDECVIFFIALGWHSQI
jgi:hypothetical protein